MYKMLDLSSIFAVHPALVTDYLPIASNASFCAWHAHAATRHIPQSGAASPTPCGSSKGPILLTQAGRLAVQHAHGPGQAAVDRAEQLQVRHAKEGRVERNHLATASIGTLSTLVPSTHRCGSANLGCQQLSPPSCQSHFSFASERLRGQRRLAGSRGRSGMRGTRLPASVYPGVCPTCCAQPQGLRHHSNAGCVNQYLQAHKEGIVTCTRDYIFRRSACRARHISGHVSRSGRRSG